MIIIIPLGGIGNRFKINGYNKPKALIKIFGKPILFWLIDNITIPDDNTIVYIPYNKEYVSYRLEDILQKTYPSINFKFFCLNKNTRGAAETLNISLKNLNLNDQPIISLDSDNFYLTDILKLWNRKNSIILFKDVCETPIYSYVLMNENNKITKIIEKEKISDYACCGSYAFSSYKELIKYTDYIIHHNIKSKNEFYTSTVISEMLKNDIIFDSIIVNSNSYISLGTPIQLRSFYNNYPKKSCIDLKNNLNKMRICFDLDNTLVTYPKIEGDYNSVDPIYKNIEYLNYLRSFGHTIIIYTARRMKTHNGNNGKIMADVGKITFDTLEKFNIYYDEIYFGKPYADVYIDDLGLNCFDDMEKELGFYLDYIKPRDFNHINNDYLETYKKESHNLSGEIYYYNNIPNKIKDMFPIFISYDINNTWYQIEKIKGLTSSTMYTSKLLTNVMLESIMNSMKRIHTCHYENNNNINIYSNYSKKIRNRYNSYDYSLFENHNQIFTELITYFDNYEKMDKGKKVVIHGDTVLTNILINDYNKIKFIDMRGELDTELTILGDYLYDWGKLYQSLIGYDNILLDKPIDEIYQKNMLDTFYKYFITVYSKEELVCMKMITKSLLFTLIPFHNNEKCIKYYNLINSSYLI